VEQFGARPIQVYAACRGEFIDEVDVEFVDISEDIQGRDLLKFKCPLCGEVHESLRH